MEQLQKDDASKMEDILARLCLNDSKKHTKTNVTLKNDQKPDPKAINKVLTGLSGRRNALKRQGLDLKEDSESDTRKEDDQSSGSDLCTPATETFDVVSSGDGSRQTTSAVDAEEMIRVKKELAAAKSMISRQEQELADARKLKHTMDQAMDPPSEADFGNRSNTTEQTINHLQSAFNASARPFTSRNDAWHPQEDSRSDNSDVLSASSYNRGRGIWNSQPTQPALVSGVPAAAALPAQFGDLGTGLGADWSAGFSNQSFTAHGALVGNQRILSGSSASSYDFDARTSGESPHFGGSGNMRRTMSQYNRAGSGFSSRSTPYGSYASNFTNLNPASIGPLGMAGPLGYQPRPIGSPLSPSNSDFASGSLTTSGSPWSPVSGFFSLVACWC